jgi:RNA polymerase sigma factor (sigma-70 family)
LTDDRDRGPGPPAAGLVEHFFRHEYGRLVATLTRMFGPHRLALVEDAVQSALMTALTPWSLHGPPEDPSAWLYRVAYNKMLDGLRRHAARQRILDRHGDELAGIEEQPPSRFANEVNDDLLRMLFVCCDEVLPPDSRVVLALKTLCGLSTSEIALRLFTTEANVYKRVSRAHERLKEIAPDGETPPLDSLQSRLPSIHTVIYLLFNEGYLSTQAAEVVRRELCDEAIRLGTLLAEHPIATPETHALLSLMHFHAARLASRVDALGELLPLADQDRSLWDRERIAEGARWLARAADGDVFSRYHAEAAIAAEHCFAPSFAATRWNEIADLYAMLERIAPSPLYTMNRAIAVAEARGPDAGLALLDEITPPGWLSGFYLWDAVLGDLHRRAGNVDRARKHIERALERAPSEAERALLRKRLASLG